MRLYNLLVLIAVLLGPFTPVHAGEADVVAVEAVKSGDRTYQFAVTVRHADEGWDHYANKWDIVGPDGTLLGTRTLHHPHVDEQPFKRSLAGVKVPGNVNEITIRAHDLVHEYGGKIVELSLPQ